MSRDRETRQRILLLMRDRMLQSGYSKVTLDELADELGISKKTVYKYFSGKDELAMEAIRFNFSEIESEFNAIHASPRSFTEKLHSVLMVMRERVGKLSASAIQDIRKHAPQLWKEIEKLRRERILSKVELMIRRAREEGVLRKDVDERLLVRILLASVEAVANPDTQAALALPMHEIIYSMFRILFEGALTDEGRAQTPIFQPAPAERAPGL